MGERVLRGLRRQRRPRGVVRPGADLRGRPRLRRGRRLPRARTRGGGRARARPAVPEGRRLGPRVGTGSGERGRGRRLVDGPERRPADRRVRRQRVRPRRDPRPVGAAAVPGRPGGRGPRRRADPRRVRLGADRRSGGRVGRRGRAAGRHDPAVGSGDRLADGRRLVPSDRRRSARRGGDLPGDPRGDRRCPGSVGDGGVRAGDPARRRGGSRARVGDRWPRGGPRAAPGRGPAVGRRPAGRGRGRGSRRRVHRGARVRVGAPRSERPQRRSRVDRDPAPRPRVFGPDDVRLGRRRDHLRDRGDPGAGWRPAAGPGEPAVPVARERQPREPAALHLVVRAGHRQRRGRPLGFRTGGLWMQVARGPGGSGCRSRAWRVSGGAVTVRDLGVAR